MKLNESRYDMAEGVVVETTDATGRVVDQRTEWNVVDGVTEPEAEDVIALVLAGNDEVTDEIVAQADEIVAALRKTGFLDDEDPDAPDDGKVLIAGILYDVETGEEADPQ